METINLDCIDKSDLVVVVMYGQYATKKIEAAGLRLTGRIKEAIEVESQMNTIYETIPHKYRW